jgi:hypothetical protein
MAVAGRLKGLAGKAKVRAIGAIRGGVKLDKSSFALEKGTLKDLRLAEKEALRFFRQDEQDLLKEKKALRLIKEVEKDLIRLEKDQMKVRQILKHETEIWKSQKNPAWGQGMISAGKHYNAGAKLQNKLYYKTLADAQKVLQDAETKIEYIRTLVIAVRNRKALELKEDQALDKWVMHASGRMRGLRKFVQEAFQQYGQLNLAQRKERGWEARPIMKTYY